MRRAKAALSCLRTVHGSHCRNPDRAISKPPSTKYWPFRILSEIPGVPLRTIVRSTNRSNRYREPEEVVRFRWPSSDSTILPTCSAGLLPEWWREKYRTIRRRLRPEPAGFRSSYIALLRAQDHWRRIRPWRHQVLHRDCWPGELAAA